MNYADYLQSAQWKSLRARALRVSGHRCIYCSSQATEVHHQRYPPPGKWEQDNIRNLQAVCFVCHKKIHEDKQMKLVNLDKTPHRIESLPWEHGNTRVVVIDSMQAVANTPAEWWCSYLRLPESLLGWFITTCQDKARQLELEGVDGAERMIFSVIFDSKPFTVFTWDLAQRGLAKILEAYEMRRDSGQRLDPDEDQARMILDRCLHKAAKLAQAALYQRVVTPLATDPIDASDRLLALFEAQFSPRIGEEVSRQLSRFAVGVGQRVDAVEQRVLEVSASLPDRKTLMSARNYLILDRHVSPDDMPVPNSRWNIQEWLGKYGRQVAEDDGVMSVKTMQRLSGASVEVPVNQYPRWVWAKAWNLMTSEKRFSERGAA